MIRSGLVSITFRGLSPQKIIALAARAELNGIEWGGDVHVPHGDTAKAREVLKATRRSNLEVAAYGSYYHVGHSEGQGLPFSQVLNTAIELEAPLIRVWAGEHNSEDCSAEYFQLIVNELRHICEIASKSAIHIATEFHAGTLCNTAASARRVLDAVDHLNLKTLWQPPACTSYSKAAKGLRELWPYLSNLHVFQWQGYERRPLEEGVVEWNEYFSVTKNQADWALLEFVRGDDPRQFLQDAATLKSWLNDSDI